MSQLQECLIGSGQSVLVGVGVVGAIVVLQAVVQSIVVEPLST